MRHVMIDTETWGVRPGSAIRSIGACEFEFRGEVGRTFYQNIDKQSCLDAGLTVDESTEKWWANQSAAARAGLETDQKPLAEVVVNFHKWFSDTHAVFVWCQGASFDVPLWEAAARAVQKLPLPWYYYNSRCTRTIYHVANLDTRDMGKPKIAHHALEDALHQTMCVQEAFRRIYGKFLAPGPIPDSTGRLSEPSK